MKIDPKKLLDGLKYCSSVLIEDECSNCPICGECRPNDYFGNILRLIIDTIDNLLSEIEEYKKITNNISTTQEKKE